jgi:hypothetical protein
VNELLLSTIKFQGVAGIKQTEIQTAQPFVPEPSISEVEVATETFHTKSSSQKTIVHPTISDFNEIWYTASMDKYNNPYFFYFLHTDSRSVFTALLKITLNVGILQISAKQWNDTVCFN